MAKEFISTCPIPKTWIHIGGTQIFVEGIEGRGQEDEGSFLFFWLTGSVEENSCLIYLIISVN
jgi:hypothetical protein